MSEVSQKAQSVKVQLKYPIEWGQEGLVKEVELKRPKGKHIKGLSKDIAMGDLFQIAAKVSGYTPAFFDELDAVDCLKISEVIGGFLEAGPETGRTV